MPYIDFAELKSRTTVMQTAQMLALTLKPSGNQQRGPCPVCNTGGDRALVITPERGLFYCFPAKTGGDLIKLVAHIKGCSQNEAAQLIQSHVGGTVQPVPARNAGTVPYTSPTAPQNQKAGLNPLPYLEPEHAAVQALGISPATAAAFGSGYAGKGVLRGRYAVPVHGKDGTLLAYVGIAVSKEQSPRLLFHNFDPGSTIFNAHRLADGGDLFVCRDPLQLLLAVENGIAAESVVAFLSDAIAAQQFEMLAALMDEKKTEPAQLF
jgi:CHC2 zinc finger